jgi:uncharacterized lipoprotein NlpE involved in copper resistance
MKRVCLLVVAVMALGACSGMADRAPSTPAPMVRPVDMHTSRNSLDWAGTYEGVGPCADCPGRKLRLTLNQDGTYVLESSDLGRPQPPASVQGVFTWQPGGNAITLDAHGGELQFQVREGSLAALPHGGAPGASPPAYVLTLVPRR